MSQNFVLALINYGGELVMPEASLARAITLFARYFTSNYPGKDVNTLVELLTKLYPYFEGEKAKQDSAKLITDEVTKLLVTFLQLSPDLKNEVLEFINQRPELIKFYKRSILRGPEDKVV